MNGTFYVKPRDSMTEVAVYGIGCDWVDSIFQITDIEGVVVAEFRCGIDYWYFEPRD